MPETEIQTVNQVKNIREREAIQDTININESVLNAVNIATTEMQAVNENLTTLSLEIPEQTTTDVSNISEEKLDLLIDMITALNQKVENVEQTTTQLEETINELPIIDINPEQENE